MKAVNFICLGLEMLLVKVVVYRYSIFGDNNITMSIESLLSAFGFLTIIYRECLKENKNEMKTIIRELELLKTQTKYIN